MEALADQEILSAMKPDKNYKRTYIVGTNLERHEYECQKCKKQISRDCGRGNGAPFIYCDPYAIEILKKSHPTLVPLIINSAD